MLVAALGAAVTVYASQMTAAREGRDQSVPLHRWLFNVCNCLLAAGAGGLAYDWVYTHGGLRPDQALVPATLAWTPQQTYIVTFAAGAKVQDVAGGMASLPAPADLTICFQTDVMQ